MPPTDTTSSSDALSALSYEEARDELVRVVGELERGSATLEESIALWERGEALARHCEEWLIGAKARLDAARAGTVGSNNTGSGTVGSSPAGSDTTGTEARAE